MSNEVRLLPGTLMVPLSTGAAARWRESAWATPVHRTATSPRTRVLRNGFMGPPFVRARSRDPRRGRERERAYWRLRDAINRPQGVRDVRRSAEHRAREDGGAPRRRTKSTPAGLVQHRRCFRRRSGAVDAREGEHVVRLAGVHA